MIALFLQLFVAVPVALFTMSALGKRKRRRGKRLR